MKGLILFAVGLALFGSAIHAKENNDSDNLPKSSILNAADGKPPYGEFDVTASDGQVYREIIRVDGTFSSTAKDGSTVEGVWQQREDGIFCSKPFKAPLFRCKFEEVNAQGVWTSTEIDGDDVSTIQRLED